MDAGVGFGEHLPVTQRTFAVGRLPIADNLTMRIVQ